LATYHSGEWRVESGSGKGDGFSMVKVAPKVIPSVWGEYKVWEQVM
jgi:hypothetical protein